jgi:DNA gyrase subunit A
VREIRVVGRNTQGVRIMGLKEGDKIASIAKVAEEEGEAIETDEMTDTPTPDATV